jgi:hypothetical protein
VVVVQHMITLGLLDQAYLISYAKIISVNTAR